MPNDEKLFRIAYSYHLYYTSYHLLKKSLSAPSAGLDKNMVDNVIDIIHPSLYIYDQQLDQFSNKKTLLDFPVGLRLFFQNKTKLAEERLKSIKPENPMFIESNYILGLINLKKKKNADAYKYFQLCSKSAKNKKPTEFKTEAYIETFEGRCIQQLSRIEYSAKNYKKSISILDLARKTDYIWPHLFLDKAWSYYREGDRPRAMGTILSFDAPILQKFIIPEAIYIKALIYFDFCRYDKVEEVFKNFTPLLEIQNEISTITSNQMQALISAQTLDENKKKIKEFYLHLKSFKKDIRYLNYKKSADYLNNEIKKLEKFKHMKKTPQFIEELKAYKYIVEEDFRDLLTNLRDDYLKQVEASHRNFVKMNLFISSQRRKQVTSKKVPQINKGKIIDLNNIPHSIDQSIWDFRGGFWADELGDYAVALEDRCEK
jgi:hypothetical protein